MSRSLCADLVPLYAREMVRACSSIGRRSTQAGCAKERENAWFVFLRLPWSASRAFGTCRLPWSASRAFGTCRAGDLCARGTTIAQEVDASGEKLRCSNLLDLDYGRCEPQPLTDQRIAPYEVFSSHNKAMNRFNSKLFPPWR